MTAATLAGYREEQHPRDPHTGEWAHTPGGAPSPGGGPSLADLLREADKRPLGQKAGPLPAHLIDTINGTYGGLRAEVNADRSWLGGDSAHIIGEIRAPDGTRVGNFERRIKTLFVEGPPSGMRLVAENSEMVIDRAHQGQGFASAFNRHMEDQYRRAGISEVRVSANFDVGGYAWARTGFDWLHRSSAEVIGGRFRAAIIVAEAVASGKAARPDLSSASSPVKRATLALADDPAALAQARDLIDRLSEPFGSADYPTPFEFSNVGRKAGSKTWPGRDLLLGASWEGVKPL